MPDRNPEQKVAVIRQVADFIERGGPQPINLSFVGDKIEILCNQQADWESWLGEFSGSPVDASYQQGETQPDVTFVSWSDDLVEVTYLIYAEKVA
jgi:hypothetical protein